MDKQYIIIFYIICGCLSFWPSQAVSQNADSLDFKEMSERVRTSPATSYYWLKSLNNSPELGTSENRIWYLIRTAQAENLLYLYDDFDKTVANAFELVTSSTSSSAMVQLNIFSGMMERRKSKYQSAKTYFLKAMSLAQSYQLVPLYLAAKQEYAYTLSLLNQYETSLSVLNEAHALALELGDIFIVAIINETYGAVYGYMKKNELSVSYYEQALQGYKSVNAAPYVAEAIYGLATTYRYWKKYELAINNFKHYLEIIHYADNSEIRFYGSYGLGMTYAEKGDCSQALAVIEEALGLSGALDYKVELLKQKARCQIKSSELELAENTLLQAEEIFEQLPELKGTSWEIEIGAIYSVLEKERGNFEAAYQLMLDYYQRKTKIDADLSDERLASLQNSFEIEKRDAKINLLQEQAKAQALKAEKNYQNSISQQYKLAFVIFFAIIVLIAFFWQRRNTKKFIALSSKDALSGLFNRRYIFEVFEKAFSSATSEQGSLYVLLLDIDNFKKINDHYGHVVGDDVIKKLSKLCQETLRLGDTIGRIGGEEFLCILPRIDDNQSRSIAQRMSENIVNNVFTNNEGVTFKVTISIGIAKYSKSCSITKDLFLQADKALYHAKNSGKNKVVFFDDI
jgi:diguanylate cyclase (GGDEF)-like protein